MDYYLRYATNAMIAGNMDVLDEQVLHKACRETYNSLGVPIGPTIQGIQIMKEIVKDQVALGSWSWSILALDEPFDYMTRELSEDI